MSLINRTYSFTDGTVAYGSQVESEIANIVNTLNSLDAATTTWANVKATTFTPQSNIAMGGYKLTGLTAGTSTGDSVAYEQITGNLVPTGTIIQFVSVTPPTGYLYCDGTAVSRSTYSNLFSLIGVTCGSGNGSSTFNLPDYRGRFLRGVDGGAARDPDAASRTAMNSGGNTGDNFGSVQAGANASHTHTASVTDPGHTHQLRTHTTTGANGLKPVGQTGSEQASSPDSTYVLSTTTGVTVSNSSTGGNESRPLNANVYFHIKF